MTADYDFPLLKAFTNAAQAIGEVLSEARKYEAADGPTVRPCPETIRRLYPDPASGAGLIFAERVRHMEDEGFDYEHDDRHSDGELARAAACYALPAAYRLAYPQQVNGPKTMPLWWPWDLTWWKPARTNRLKRSAAIEDRKRELAKAGAMIAAEIDRLSRLQTEEVEPDEDA